MQVINLDKTMNEVTVGTVVNDTAVVMLCKKKFDRVVGDCFATWLALCFNPANLFHPYVVWNVIARPEGFVAESGDYRKTLNDALDAYKVRGGEIS
jgi:hypothetical protein